MNSRYEVVVIVGTDHHPFNRLITWVNEWLSRHQERVGDFFVQWGSATVRPICDGAEIITTDRLGTLLGDARVVICHGGGGSISDAWSAGLEPIVVPRLPQLGEHVDDHQVHFSFKLAELRRIRVAESQAEFSGLLDESIGDGQAKGLPQPRLGSPEAEVDATIARFATLIEELVSRPRSRFSMLGGFRPSSSRSRTRAGSQARVDSTSQGSISGGEQELARKG
jgi:UDP-N-acetylglucosamine transferase subunit ALG13